MVERAWSRPFHISSNFARDHPVATAMAASLGWITNVSPDGLGISRQWHVTFEGLVAYQTRQPERNET